ncbi:DNA-processing protein DprA [Syntrophomonas palmitatica]|uniref:DNA-processing protein DprA n=1 Tax=Syntrophomonas palmitatica TaxID=402877 RepID=UPI0006D0527E|nr:DNA-processing protein DprA [Syntrophomonas palmitatica]
MEPKETAALAVLHSIKGIGNKTLWTIAENFGSFAACWNAPTERLNAAPLSAEIVRDIIELRKRVDPLQYLESILSRGIRAVSWQDSEYPAQLRNISNPPYIFYCQGQIEAAAQPCIGIVGSRQASNYGRTVAHRFARELAGHGITIVSGMARGIDSEAHLGALESGKTAAVLGNGLNIIYPPENKHLFEQITMSGLVMTEFPLNSGPEPKHFPMRNRIISGLCRGIVVIEARQKSGALITADFAWSRGATYLRYPVQLTAKTVKVPII